jgi:hypothetical protein
VSRALPTYHAALCDAVATGLEAGAVVRLRARGASMRPFLRDGEDVRIVPVRIETIRPGDVVLVRTEGGAALHRVLAIDLRAATLLTKGDSVRAGDRATGLDAVVGRADAVLRRDRWIPLDTRARRLLGCFVSRVLAPREPLRALARLILSVRRLTAARPFR